MRKIDRCTERTRPDLLDVDTFGRSGGVVFAALAPSAKVSPTRRRRCGALVRVRGDDGLTAGSASKRPRRGRKTLV